MKEIVENSIKMFLGSIKYGDFIPLCSCKLTFILLNRSTCFCTGKED